ncbi:MAG TPA: glucanase [Elusimicrobia bacterium]|nr:MAG: glucanase [Elusimicrobia bacterium GWF2_62_30]HBA62206.1 glucanase [Elusimicrobiota bacterium]
MKNAEIIELLRKLEAINSPSGYTKDAIAFLAELFRAAGLNPRLTNKGALLVCEHPEPATVCAAHVDTLGAMVTKLEGDGTLRVTQVGGWPWNSFEGEYVTVMNSAGKKWRGTFLSDNPAAHVNRNIGKTERSAENMHIRLDAEVKTAADTKKLGIDAGDYVFFDPRFEATETGFIRSRFLDDKAGCAVLAAVILDSAAKLKKMPVAFFFSNYEEVGHGGSAGIPRCVREMIAVDMGVVGHNVGGHEAMVSICAKDSTGPHDFELRQRLVSLARKKRIPHVVDVFPFYGSDAHATMGAGYDVRVAVIGPGVSASHGVERTHIKGINATVQLVEAYLADLCAAKK